MTEPSQLPFFREPAHHVDLSHIDPHKVAVETEPATPAAPPPSPVILPSPDVILPQAGSPDTPATPVVPTSSPVILPTAGSPALPPAGIPPQAGPPNQGTMPLPSGVTPPHSGAFPPPPSATPPPGAIPSQADCARDRAVPGGGSPLAVPSLSQIPWAASQGLDWAAVATMRAAASTRLSNRIGTERLDKEHQQTLGRLIIDDLLSEHESEALAEGKPGWEPAYQARMGQAVFDALFQLGRLQPLVDDDRIENIIISGADNVWLEFSDGAMVRGPAVADSDQELIDFLSFIASRSEVNERSFSPATPRLHMQLDSGARLAAAAWVTPRPSVVIRRHRLQEVTLNDLVERHTLTEPMARFLAEAVRRRASIVVSGAQGVGKTTLMRALCSEIPPEEIIGTFETEYELHLHLMGNLHRVVYAWEARPGSGEMDAYGHRAGEFTLDDALYDSFRFDLSRQIVGEVRGREILAMLKAMQSGSGSLSTTHAHSAEGAIRKLITCAMEAGPQVTSAYATRAIAEDIDFIVHMEMTHDNDSMVGKTFRHRWVKEILAIQPSDSVRGYSTTRLFSTPAGEVQAVMENMPEDYLDVIDPVEDMWDVPWP